MNVAKLEKAVPAQPSLKSVHNNNFGPGIMGFDSMPQIGNQMGGLPMGNQFGGMPSINYDGMTFDMALNSLSQADSQYYELLKLTRDMGFQYTQGSQIPQLIGIFKRCHNDKNLIFAELSRQQEAVGPQPFAP